MAEPFDPYYKWLGIPPKDQPPNHYRLLAIELFEPDPEVIDAAANRLMAYIQDFSNGPHVALSQKLLNELAAARVCLLNRASKSEYDEKLRTRLSAASPPSAPPRRLPMARPLEPNPRAAVPVPPPPPPVVGTRSASESPPVEPPVISIDLGGAKKGHSTRTSAAKSGHGTKPSRSTGAGASKRRTTQPRRDRFQTAMLVVGGASILGVLVTVVLMLMNRGSTPGPSSRPPGSPAAPPAVTVDRIGGSSSQRPLEAALSAPTPDRLAAGVGYVHVICHRGGDLLLAAVKINGQDAGNFLVDTGAPCVAVDEAIANKLNLPQKGQAELSGPLGRSSVSLRTTRTLSVGSVAFDALEVAAVDLLPCSQALGIKLAGVVGYDVWQGQPFTIDYAGNMITFHDPARFTPPGNVPESPLTVTDRRPQVSGWAVSPEPGLLTLATGAQAGLVLGRSAMTRKPESLVPRGASVSLAGLEGSRAVRQTTAELGLFDRAYAGLWSLLPPGEPNTGETDSGPLGVVGGRVLRRFRLTFDYAASKVWAEFVPFNESPDRDALQLTALITAAQSGDLDRLRGALKEPHDLEAVCLAGKTALRHAIDRGYNELADELIQSQAAVNASDKQGQTPLMAAVQIGDTALVDRLLEAGAEVNARSLTGLTPLLIAAWHGRPEIVQQLLKAGAEVDAADHEGITPLMVAARQGHTDAARRLLEHKADARLKNKRGAHALQIARAYQHAAMAELIRSFSPAAAARPSTASPGAGTPRPVAPKVDTTIDDRYFLAPAALIGSSAVFSPAS
jgi:ankyrin repeat protein